MNTGMSEGRMNSFFDLAAISLHTLLSRLFLVGMMTEKSMSSHCRSNQKFFRNYGGPNEAQLTYKLSDKECTQEVSPPKHGEVTVRTYTHLPCS